VPRPCNKKRFRTLPFGSLLRTYGRFLAQDLEVQFAPTKREMAFEAGIFRFLRLWRTANASKHRTRSRKSENVQMKNRARPEVARRLLGSVHIQPWERLTAP
jgi:hypothetical protein